MSYIGITQKQKECVMSKIKDELIDMLSNDSNERFLLDADNEQELLDYLNEFEEFAVNEIMLEF